MYYAVHRLYPNWNISIQNILEQGTVSCRLRYWLQHYCFYDLAVSLSIDKVE